MKKIIFVIIVVIFLSGCDDSIKSFSCKNQGLLVAFSTSSSKNTKTVKNYISVKYLKKAINELQKTFIDEIINDIYVDYRREIEKSDSLQRNCKNKNLSKKNNELNDKNSQDDTEKDKSS